MGVYGLWSQTLQIVCVFSSGEPLSRSEGGSCTPAGVHLAIRHNGKTLFISKSEPYHARRMFREKYTGLVGGAPPPTHTPVIVGLKAFLVWKLPNWSGCLLYQRGVAGTRPVLYQRGVAGVGLCCTKGVFRGSARAVPKECSGARPDT